jgi:hypothetical protein
MNIFLLAYMIYERRKSFSRRYFSSIRSYTLNTASASVVAIEDTNRKIYPSFTRILTDLFHQKIHHTLYQNAANFTKSLILAVASAIRMRKWALEPVHLSR